MDRTILLLGLIFIIYGTQSVRNKEKHRIRDNNKAFNDRILELRQIITDKDITYKARIEELIYMKNKYF